MLLVTLLTAPIGGSCHAQDAATAAHDTAIATADDPGWGEMTPERRAEAIAYSTTRNIFYFVTFAYSALVLLVILYTGFAARMLAWAERVGRRRFFTMLIFLLLFMAVSEAASLPLTYYLGYVLEHQYELSNQTVGAFMLDWAKGFGVSFVLLAVFVWILYALIRRCPKSWWAWVGVVSVPILFFLIVLSPLIITPLFYKQSPMDEGPLKTRILDLASRSGIDESRVFVLDASRETKKLNAYVTGLRKTKRIVLFDNLIATMSPDEVLFVVGHEMGHYVLNHVWIGFGIAVMMLFIFAYLIHRYMTRIIAMHTERFGFDRLSSYASLPLIALFLSVCSFLSEPLVNGFGRHIEHQADIFGLEATRNAAAAEGAFEKLASANLANPDPHPFIRFWRYSHPTLSERVRFARAFQGGGESGGSGAAPIDSLAFPGETHLRNIRQLTFGGQNAEAYFNSTGDRLIFQTTRDGYDCDRIFSMNIDGGDVRQVSVPGGVTTCSFFAPDGKRVIYCSTYLVDDSCPPKPDRSQGYVWALYEGFDVFSVNPDGSDIKRLTTTPGYDAEAVYSPDGSKILFTSVRDGDLELYTMNPDGSNVIRLTHEVGYDGGAFFSADGSKICYRASRPADSAEAADYRGLLKQGLIRPGKLELYVMDADGSSKTKITDFAAASFCPYFHPDGKRLIFASNMDDPHGRNFDLYIINIDGSGLRRITTNETFDGFPMFNHDGTKLVWASNRNNSEPYETNVFIAEWVD
jgi:Tol biopolymer transport system component/Zn-dependent protease with chaperone function